MRYFFVILLSLVTSTNSVFDYSTRCLLYQSNCVRHCPRLMHPYHTRCDGETLSQRTCHSPNLYVLGFTCGWSRCDCNGDLVLEDSTGLCIPLKACMKPIPFKHAIRRKPDSGAKLPKNLRIKDPDPIERVMNGE